jgi:hypothetical protein
MIRRIMVPGWPWAKQETLPEKELKANKGWRLGSSGKAPA